MPLEIDASTKHHLLRVHPSRPSQLVSCLPPDSRELDLALNNICRCIRDDNFTRILKLVLNEILFTVSSRCMNFDVTFQTFPTSSNFSIFFQPGVLIGLHFSMSMSLRLCSMYQLDVNESVPKSVRSIFRPKISILSTILVRKSTVCTRNFWFNFCPMSRTSRSSPDRHRARTEESFWGSM